MDIVEKSSATAHLNFGSTCEDLPAIPSAPLGYFGGFVGYHPGSHLPGFPLQCFFDSPPYRNPPIPPPVVFRPQAASGSSDNPKPCSPAPEFPVNHTDLTNWQPLSHEGSQSAAEYNPWRQAVNPLYPMYNEQPLPQEQREAYYQQFAEALGPAYGVQESVGTYRAYMTQQVQTYYERLVPPRSSGGVPGPYSQALLPTPVSVAVSTRTPSGGYTSRASTPHLPRPPNGVRPSGGLGFSQPRIIAHNNANSGVSSRSSVSSVSTPVSSESSGGTSFWPWAASHPGDSEPPLDISELLESPILRSRSSSQENSPSSESSALPTPDTQDFTSDDLVTYVLICCLPQ